MNKGTRDLEAQKIKYFDQYQKEIVTLKNDLQTLQDIEIEPAYDTLDLCIGNHTQNVSLDVSREAYKAIKKILLEYLDCKLAGLQNLQKTI